MSAHSITSRGLAGRKIPQGTLTPIGALLFAASEPGAWYDPSDMSTLFQDSAGTTPVTAVEQPVGRILDKSGRGNHATQATTTKRPVYSRRVNLCYLTESMTPSLVAGTGWTRGAFDKWTTPTSLGAQLAPDGTTNAVGIRTVGTASTTTLVQRHNVAPSTPMVFRLWVRTVDGEVQTGLSGVRLVAQTGNSGTLVSADYFSSVIGTSITGIWQQFEIQFTTPATGANQVEVGVWLASAATAAVAVWGASLTPAIDAHLPYQWVNTTTDYDADPSKFPAYLRFDGVDDALQTGNIDFTSTDKMTVWAGITKLTDVSTQTIAELSANKNANNGVFALFCPFSNLSRTYWYSKGTTESQAVALVTAGAASLVITGIGDVAGDVSRLRLNGSTAIATTDQGPGNYGNYPLYIGSRAGTSLFLNCRLYSLIVRGAQSSLSQIEATELYIKQKMRMP